MAATVTVPQLVGAAHRQSDNGSFPWTLTTNWMATKLSDGSPAPLTIVTNVGSADFGDQDDWDGVFNSALAGYATVYSNAPTIGPTNPIVIP